MKTTATLVIVSVIVIACHRKAVASSDDIIISNKTKTEEKRQAATVATASTGQNIYSTRCGRCHYMKTVQDYTAQQWENILKSMIPKARLNRDEATQLTVYVMEHAKK